MRLPPPEAVRIFEEASGRRYQIRHIPAEAFRAQLAAASDPLQQAFAALALSFTAGDVAPISTTLRSFFVRLRSVRGYAVQTVEPTASPPVPP